MKKMMIMMVVLCTAAVTQATTLKWGGNAPTSSFKNLTGGAMTYNTGSETASMLVLYILATDYAAFDANTTKGTAITKAKATALGAVSTSTFSAGIIGASIAPNIVDSVSGISYIARVYATFGGTEYYLDNKTGWTTKTTDNNTVTETLAWTAGTWGGATGTFGTQNAWVNTVPEPTSMALLALGVAAIGLRRRFKK